MNYIPERKCVACHKIKPKEELLRLVKTADHQFQIDLTNQQNGRGAYVCKQKDCILEAIRKNAFQRSLKTKIPAECIEKLEEYIKENDYAG